MNRKKAYREDIERYVMEKKLIITIVILLCILLVMSVKICLMRQAAREMREGIGRIPKTETNVLLTVPCRDGEMRRLAAALNEELRGLRRQRCRYEQGDLQLKETVANVSHDIRTPLTAVCGYLDLARQQLERPAGQEDLEAVKRYLYMMENRTEALKQLTEELFRYAAAVPGAQMQEIVSEEIVLNRELEESIAVYYAALKNNNITPVINMPEQQIKCRLNKGMLSRIFGNIIGNAMKYSDGDLMIRLYETGEMLFANHASGLDEVQAGKLFDRFYTVHSARKSTGLGLSIARQLTERMGGNIDAHYRDGVLSIHLFFPN